MENGNTPKSNRKQYGKKDLMGGCENILEKSTTQFSLLEELTKKPSKKVSVTSHNSVRN
jgi:hypothetical protein